MRRWDFGRQAFALYTCVALLTACGGSQTPLGAPRALQLSRASDGYTSLYSFGAYPDAQQPKAALLNLDGTLYGTTYLGGKHGLGAVFSISTTGTEKVLYNFNFPGGENPAAGLTAVRGVLYGTTANGGALKAGTVFRLTTSGNETLLHSFGPLPDGLSPMASLTLVKGRLYGTTYSGGANIEYGTVFRITTGGKETVLHSFFPYSDGARPVAGLTSLNGILYGVTEIGQVFTGSNGGYGTVFTMNLNGDEKILYSFSLSDSVGWSPQADLIKVKGVFYGTTAVGGPQSGGTAYRITTSGSITALHGFGSGADGSTPLAPLLYTRGAFYGTTSAGGAYGKGTIFRISRNGREKVLHSFGDGSDGATPLAGLINVKGTLFGTTSAGGMYGNGSVFAITLSSES